MTAENGGETRHLGANGTRVVNRSKLRYRLRIIDYGHRASVTVRGAALPLVSDGARHGISHLQVGR